MPTITTCLPTSERTMSFGPPARLLPPWIQTSTGSLPRQRWRAHVEGQAIFTADQIVGVVPALVVLHAGGRLRA